MITSIRTKYPQKNIRGIEVHEINTYADLAPALIWMTTVTKGVFCIGYDYGCGIDTKF
jgi:hypothetical protein